MASFHNWTGDEVIDKQVPQFLNKDNAATQEKLDTKFNKSLEIAEASDLNNFKDEGFYCCNFNSWAETILNCPTNYAFGLMVWGKGEIVYQEVREYNRSSKNQEYNNCWRRSYYSSEEVQGAWSKWQQMSYSATTLAGYGITDGMHKNFPNSVSVTDIMQRDINTSYLRLMGGTAIVNGAALQLCGGAYTGDIADAGQFSLSATDSTHSAVLLGNPSGLLRWNDKNIVRSVNNSVADDNGNVTITVDAALSDTSMNPVQNKVIKDELDRLLLQSGKLSTPSSSSAYVCKLAADALSSINDITQTTIEQSADGETWETVFDSDIASADVKIAYLYGLQLPTSITIPSGYMARVTFATHTTTYFASISMFLVARSPSSNFLSYKCYTGFNTLTSNARVQGTISTFGSWPSAAFTSTNYNIVQYVFNEDKKADSSLVFNGMQCKGTETLHNVLRFDEAKQITSTPFGIQAPTYNGYTIESSVPANAKFIDNATANTWTAQQTFNEVVLNREKYTTNVVRGNSDTPITSTMVYNVTGAFTLNLATLTKALSANQSSVFTAYFAANADYSLTISNAGKLKYVGSASDVAITSAGLLLNIWMSKDDGGTLTSIVQASKLS